VGGGGGWATRGGAIDAQPKPSPRAQATQLTGVTQIGKSGERLGGFLTEYCSENHCGDDVMWLHSNRPAPMRDSRSSDRYLPSIQKCRRPVYNDDPLESCVDALGNDVIIDGQMGRAWRAGPKHGPFNSAGPGPARQPCRAWAAASARSAGPARHDYIFKIL
jgi:hypothetical protein